MPKHTKEDIFRIVKENDIEFIRLQFTDIFGALKNIAITSKQLGRALDNEYMFDGSSVEGFARIEESDMYLYPDIDTFAVLPWQKGVARLICDVYNTEHKPFEGDPRNVLRRAIKRADEMGYTFNVGPECEFFLFQNDENGNPTTNTHDAGGYFDLAPTDRGEDARRDIAVTLESMGFEVEASHHENAPAQHEIDFKYDEALPTADKIMTFKLVVKTIAQAHGLHATFMPKPIFGCAGSGMHVNMSLSKNGKNVFFDPSAPDGLSREALSFIAGVMAHVKGMAAVTNPLVNSYKRLVPGYEAPIYIAWSNKNRSPMIRIPASRGAGTRIELRSPDPSSNPYLVIALCLQAGLDGIEKGLTPPPGVECNLYEMDEKRRRECGIESFPLNLSEAVGHMTADKLVLDALGPHVAEKYISAKLDEWYDFSTAVTEWEKTRYLARY